MIIREAILQDIPKIAQLAKVTYIVTFGQTMSEDELNEALKVRSEKYFYTIFGRDIILVVKNNKDLVGFIQFGEPSYKKIVTNDNDIELKKIYVEKNHQGQGIGKSLMEAMFKHNRLIKIQNIYLDVFAKNKQAIGLYRKYGFQIVGKIPFIVGDKTVGYDLLMKKVKN